MGTKIGYAKKRGYVGLILKFGDYYVLQSLINGEERTEEFNDRTEAINRLRAYIEES